MPFTKEFFIYLPPKNPIDDRPAKLRLFYRDPPIYFESWLSKRSTSVQEAYAKTKKISDIYESVAKSKEYQNGINQVIALILAIRDWGLKNDISYSLNKFDLLVSNLRGRSIGDEDIPQWLSANKKILEEIYLLLNYSDEVSFEQKKQAMKKLSEGFEPGICAPGAYLNIKRALGYLVTDWSSYLTQARLEIVQALALDEIEEKNLCNEDNGDNEIHYANTLTNYVADHFGILIQEDSAARNIDENYLEPLEPFAKKVEMAMKPSTVACQLTQMLLTASKGPFSHENMPKITQLGNKLACLGQDPYLIANLKRKEEEEKETDLADWIFEATTLEKGYQTPEGRILEVDEYILVPRPENTIAFILQCTIIARLVSAGYLSDDTITPIDLDEKYQLMLLPSDINASWVQPREMGSPPEPLEEFLKKNPAYYLTVEKIVLGEKTSPVESIDSLQEEFSRLGCFCLPFLKRIEDSVPSLMHQVDKNSLLALIKLLPQGEARVTFLQLVRDYCLPSLNKLLSDKRIFAFIKSLPADETRIELLTWMQEKLSKPLRSYALALNGFDFLFSLVGCLPEHKVSLKFLTSSLGKSDFGQYIKFNKKKQSFIFIAIIKCLKQEDYVEFFQLLSINNLQQLLEFLPEDLRLSFLKSHVDAWIRLTQKSEDFIRIMQDIVVTPEEKIRFLQLPSVANWFKDVKNTDKSLFIERLVVTLFSLSNEDCLSYLSKTRDTWVNFLNAGNDLSTMTLCFKTRGIDSSQLFDLIGSDKLIEIVRNTNAELIDILEKLPPETRILFLRHIKTQLGEVLTAQNMDPIINRLAESGDLPQLQSFFHTQEMRAITLQSNFQNSPSPNNSYLAKIKRSILHRKLIEESIDTLEAKAHALNTKSRGKSERTLELVQQFRAETHRYFSEADLNNKESAQAYLSRCKEFTLQTDVSPKERIDAYREEIGFGQLINRILVTIATVLSLGIALLIPSVFNTVVTGNTETRSRTNHVLKTIRESRK